MDRDDDAMFGAMIRALPKVIGHPGLHRGPTRVARRLPPVRKRRLRVCERADAMAAGVSNHVWSIEEIVALTDRSR
ncbi:MAG: hypothetical protein ABI051_16175 [Vicinamibacterales bacterium]